MYLATVSIYTSSDTSLITYRLSDKDGIFKIPGLPFNTPLRAIITYSGYEVLRKEFSLSPADNHLNLDTLWMTPNATSLDEVLVVAERPPMTVRKDTIEFNATAFKTLPNALVEDLLKKLPGVQVDRDGNIMVNGKRVNRIMVDGKSFFGDDPKMASRNLPSNVIDKIQVTDDKEEMLRNGDDNPNNVGKVINLTFKKGVKKGLFGKAYAGGGTHDRYEAGAIANIFRDTLQASILAYSNNLNRPGFSFSELMQTGGIKRSSDVTGSRSVSINRDAAGGTGIRVNGVHFGGITEYGGVSTSSGLGVNLNHSPNVRKSIFGQYFYGNVKVDADRDGYTELNNTDTVVRRSEKTKQDVLINAHNAGLGAKFKPDSVTSIIAGINYMVGRTLDDNATQVNSLHSKWGTLSDGRVDINENNLTQNYSHNINFNKLSNKKAGRRFNLNHDFNWQVKDNSTLTQSQINFKYPDVIDSTLHQQRKEKISTLSGSIFGNYSEPFTKHLAARVDARYAYERLNNAITSFDVKRGIYTKNNALSDTFHRISNTTSASAGLEYKYKKLTVTPRLRYQWQHFENTLASLPSSLQQDLKTLLPELSIVYGKLNVNYNKQVVLPDYQYLIPVFDNRNPYIINQGNPNLRPAIKHTLALRMNTYDTKLSLNVWGWVEGELSSRDVIQNITQQGNGIQVIEPINANKGKNLRGNAGVNKQNKFSQNFTMQSNIGFYYEYRENDFSYNNYLSRQFNNALNLWGGFGLNWNDVFELNNEAIYTLQKVRNTNTQIFKSYKANTYEISSEQILRWPKHIIFENKVTYVRNNEFVSAALREYVRWDCGINFTMFKNEAAVMRLSAFDILRKMNNTEINIFQNAFTYRKSTVIGNYYMATFTYNLRPSGVKKKVGGQSLLLF